MTLEEEEFELEYWLNFKNSRNESSDEVLLAELKTANKHIDNNFCVEEYSNEKSIIISILRKRKIQKILKD